MLTLQCYKVAYDNIFRKFILNKLNNIVYFLTRFSLSWLIITYIIRLHFFQIYNNSHIYYKI